jgi:hypothetical protein
MSPETLFKLPSYVSWVAVLGWCLVAVTASPIDRQESFVHDALTNQMHHLRSGHEVTDMHVSHTLGTGSMSVQTSPTYVTVSTYGQDDCSDVVYQELTYGTDICIVMSSSNLEANSTQYIWDNSTHTLFHYFYIDSACTTVVTRSITVFSFGASVGRNTCLSGFEYSTADSFVPFPTTDGFAYMYVYL